MERLLVRRRISRIKVGVCAWCFCHLGESHRLNRWFADRRPCAEVKDRSKPVSGWWFGCHFLFSHILGMSSSQLTFIFFRGVAQPPTRYSLNRLTFKTLGLQLRRRPVQVGGKTLVSCWPPDPFFFLWDGDLPNWWVSYFFCQLQFLYTVYSSMMSYWFSQVWLVSFLLLLITISCS